MKFLNSFKTQSTDEPQTFLRIKRFYFILFLMVLGFTYLLGGLFWRQIWQRDTIQEKENAYLTRNYALLTPRANILDRNGKNLAISVPVYDVTLDIKLLKQLLVDRKMDNRACQKYIDEAVYVEKTALRELAKHLGVNYDNLMARIRSSRGLIYLAKDQSDVMRDYIKEWKARPLVKGKGSICGYVRGIGYEQHFQRYYPEGAKMAHVLGYLNHDGNGVTGIEKSMNDILEGKDGQRQYILGRHTSQSEILKNIPTFRAEDVRLSIDVKLQNKVYDILKQGMDENHAAAASAILVNTRTGEILSMVSLPSFNPNNRAEFDAHSEKMRNRVIGEGATSYPPGSTIKPFTVLTALSKHYVKPNEKIDLESPCLRFQGSSHCVRDVRTKFERYLSLGDILKYSSNIGVSRIAFRMPSDTLPKSFSNIGFGKRVGIGLLNESAGMLPLQPLNGKNYWAKSEIAGFAYGYQLKATPLQLAQAYVMLANDGVARPLSITKTENYVLGKRIFPASASKAVREMLKGVADNNKYINIPGYTVGIKTGTARKNSRDPDTPYYAFTAGIAPLSNPRLALVVMIDSPALRDEHGRRIYYGGRVAAPIFNEIMRYALQEQHIAPDDKNTAPTANRGNFIRTN